MESHVHRSAKTEAVGGAGRRRCAAVGVTTLAAAALLAAVHGARGQSVAAVAGPATTAQPAVSGSAPSPRRPAADKAARPAPGPGATGCGSPGALGVSRVQEIDASTGPRYGHQQYKDVDFLADGEIVLTFDDGPLRPYTMPVLRALEAHCTKATFFVVGRMAQADPALVRETAQRGHTIGTHTWSHKDLRKTGPSRAKGELELGMSAVSHALGKPVAPFFRFPFLSAPHAIADYARSRNLAVFSIEVDANDYRTKDPATVHRTVLAQLQETRKGIILFHDIQPATAGALKGLLDELKTRGFKVVHLVPKAPAVTLPQYDAIADKEANRKSNVASADPLSFLPIAPALPGKASAGAIPEEEVLPWGRAVARPEPIVPAAVRPRAAPPPAPDDWVTNLFKF